MLNELIYENLKKKTEIVSYLNYAQEFLTQIDDNSDCRLELR